MASDGGELLVEATENVEDECTVGDDFTKIG
jgi:hypothetical protein